MPMNKETFDKQLKAIGDYFQFFTKKEIKHLPSVLEENETIFGMTSGFYDGKTWLITVTDRRILFLDKGMLYGLKQAEISLSQISSITHKTGLILGEIHVSSSSGTASIGQIPKKFVAPLVESLSSLINKNSDSNTNSQDVASQLEKLAELKSKGVITEEEFSEQKKRILAA